MKETEQQNQKPKGLSKSLKYLFGVGDAGFNLMSNIETFYFMTFLTDLAGFGTAIAALINSIFSIVDACLSWIYGGILNGTKAKKWGRYRSWLILVPWIVPFLYAFQFIRISDNEILSAVLIIFAAIASHVVWNIAYVANATLVSVVGKTPEDRATLASSRGTWNNIGSLLFTYLGLPFATLLANFVGERNKFAAAAFCLGLLMVLGYYAVFTPLSTILGNWLVESCGWNEYLVTVMNMLLNFVTEYLFDTFVVFRGSMDTNDIAKKEEAK